MIRYVDTLQVGRGGRECWAADMVHHRHHNITPASTCGRGGCKHVPRRLHLPLTSWLLQDALASFGWSFLSLHHVANLSLLVLLLWGWPTLARLAPLALLLPASHFALRLLPELPPSIHFKLGLYVDLLSHTPLARESKETTDVLHVGQGYMA
jgi:hypothetical protein